MNWYYRPTQLPDPGLPGYLKGRRILITVNVFFEADCGIKKMENKLMSCDTSVKRNVIKPCRYLPLHADVYLHADIYLHASLHDQDE